MDQATLKKYLDAYNRVNQFCRHNGMELEVLVPGHVKYHLTVKEEHLSSPSTAHWGILAAAMDATLGTSALTFAFTSGQVCSTVEFKINYLRPAKLADDLEAEAVLDYTGKRIVVTSGVIRRKADQDLVAKGMGTFNLYPLTKNPDFASVIN